MRRPSRRHARARSHGYDVVNHTVINPELGGDAGFERLSEALRQHGLGLILDFVPNHVGVHFADNPWWLDVLEWGEASPHAVSFDIDWELLPYRARGGVLLPILGSSYGEALEKGEIELRYDAGEGSFSAWYFEHRLPIAPERYGEILHTTVKEAAAENSAAGKRILDLASRYKGLRHPNRKEAPGLKAELKNIAGRRRNDRPRARRLSGRHRIAPRRPMRCIIFSNASITSSVTGGSPPATSTTVAFSTSIRSPGLRVEDAGTFNAAHRLVRKLIAEGKLQGLRLDHIDGLRDPAQYFQRLRRLIRDAQGKAAETFYVVVEKILGEHETLRPFTGVQGTTGYEALNTITRVLIDARGS